MQRISRRLTLGAPLTVVWPWFGSAAAISAVPELLRGFVATSVPTNSDAPGRVFRIADDRRFEVLDFSSELKIERAQVGGDIDYSCKKNIKGEFLGSLVALVNSANIGVSGDRQFEMVLKMREAILERTFDSDVKEKLKNARSSIDWEKDSKYYVIREAISTADIEFTINNLDKASLDAMAQVGKTGSARASFEYRPSEQFQFKQKLPGRYRFFFKLDELRPNFRLTGGGEIPTIPVTADLIWKIH